MGTLAITVEIDGIVHHLQEVRSLPASGQDTLPASGQDTLPASGQDTLPASGQASTSPAAEQASTPQPSKQDRTPHPGPGIGSLRTWALSTGERAVFTFSASFFSALVLGGPFSIPAADAALFAGASAALSVVTAAIRSLSPPTDDKALDVVTRVGLTLLQAFTAAFVTSTAGATHFTDWRAGALAGVAAAFTALKGTLAVQLNGPASGRPTPASLAPLRKNTGTSAPPAPALAPASP